MATERQDENIISPEAILSDLPARPTILVFDSGVGGLSVYNEIRQLLPDLHYIYAFDNEAFPYGEKPQQFIIERVVEIVTAVQQRHQLALVVIACNTASTISLPALRERFAFPVVGVVPAVKPAAKLTRNGIVGLLATRATVQRSYTHELIARFANDCQILLLGSSELVELAEAKLQGEMIPIEELRKTLRPWLRLPEPPDTVVLGCTHFPLLTNELQLALPDGTRFVDSGAAIARRTVWLVANLEQPPLSTEKNLVYCLKITPNVATLWPVLQRYGFYSLEKLPL
ncbi:MULTISPECIES: glutamate racemase [unclassified Brenneria]|uniref:glutamate racemase n=1 Tax=unclassified Brenneria TaxID=2634434 RepID=UPI0018F0EA66|nr:glutamate racemase [Brenneria sp. L3-3C-1]MBJ7222060.1 glutamate racemase [Brenneria sp. L3-3C-1]MEE3643304.1 glutamate racemase [Brenneria sp. L3_3C_1]